MAKNPFSVTPAELKALEKTYKGKTTKPVKIDRYKVDAKPRAKPQPKLEVVPMPSIGSAAQSVLGMLKGAPQGIADLAVSIPTAAYNYIRTSTPSSVASDIKSGVTSAVDAARENPGEAFADFVAGGAKGTGEMLREASLARDAGDEERAAQIEKFAVPMLLAAMVPGGRTAKGVERVAARKGVQAAERGVAREVADEALTVPRGQKVETPKVPAVPRGSDFAVRRRPRRTVPADRETTTPGAGGVDPRIESRKGEIPKVTSLTVERTQKAPVTTPDPLASLFQHEGRGVVTSMSDLSDAGSLIHAINGVEFDQPLETLGGQGYMFYTPDQVWAMDRGNAERHAALAGALRQQTGKDPIFAPWLMGLQSIDFSHMPREAMLRYGMANMNATGRQRLADTVRHFVPEFRDPSDPASMEAFLRASGKARFGLNKALDQFRNAGGLGLGAARLATSSPELLNSRLTGLHNIGIIDARAPLGVSDHFSYDTGLHGQGLGPLSKEERRLGALALLPDIMYEYNMLDPFDFPVGVVPGVKSPLRSMQMGPKGTIITDNTLRRLEQLIDRRNWYTGAED